MGAVEELVAGNRILAHEEVIDAYGHVSVRHPDRPDRFLLARSVSPALVVPDDILEFTLDGEPVIDEGQSTYIERFIHAAVYAARPDIVSVVHAHSTPVLPYTVASVPLRAVVQDASDLGESVVRWDIRDRFGDETNLLVSDIDKAADLVRSLGTAATVLLRGHGFVAAGASLPLVVRSVVALVRNAEVQTAALALGGITPLSAGEILAQRALGSQPDSPAVRRSWEYFAYRAGCADLIAR